MTPETFKKALYKSYSRIGPSICCTNYGCRGTLRNCAICTICPYNMCWPWWTMQPHWMAASRSGVWPSRTTASQSRVPASRRSVGNGSASVSFEPNDVALTTTSNQDESSSPTLTITSTRVSFKRIASSCARPAERLWMTSSDGLSLTMA